MANNQSADINVAVLLFYVAGLDVHFIHVRPPHRENQRVLPLMLVHGWPGSFYEFYKILPLLTQSRDGIVFEVVCPSIPGYGFSEAPHKQGITTLLIHSEWIHFQLEQPMFTKASPLLLQGSTASLLPESS